MMNAADLRYWLSVFWRRLPIFLCVMVVISTAGIYLAATLPSVYRATATVLIESPQIPTDLARSTVPQNTLARFQVIQQELLTRESALLLAASLDVYPPDVELSESEMAQDIRQRLALDQTFFGGDHGSLGFTISFEAGDPDLAARVANGVVARILDRDAELRSGRATQTLQFFEDEVDRLADGLAEVEARLQVYKTSHLEALPDSLPFRRTQQSTYQDRLLILEREEATLRNRRATFLQLGEAGAIVPEPQPQTPQQVLLTELRTALATQRTMFAEDSPRIVALEDRIAALEEQAGTETTAVPVRTGSPAIDLQIAEIDDRLDAIALEKTVIAQTISALDASIKATPANETALNALEREHDNLQTLYNAALERLAEASTGEMIEASFRGERLSLVEAALPPERALRPRRLTIAAASLAGGMALGLGLVFLVELLQRPLRRPVQLERVLGIEPLATIPYMRTNAQLWRRRLLTAVALTAVVSAWPLLQMLLVNSDLSLASMLSATLGRLEGLVS